MGRDVERRHRARRQYLDLQPRQDPGSGLLARRQTGEVLGPEDGLFKNPHTIRFDSAGGLWIVDTLTQTVRKFSPDGKVLMTIGTPNEAGVDQTHMNQPNDVAFASNGDIYVSDGYGNDRIVVFDKHGKYVRSWGKLGTGPGEFSQPHSIVIDSKDRVYVADRNNVRIQIFDSKGKYLTEWKNIITPWALAITKNGRDLRLREFSHAMVGSSREPGCAGDASQGSALHEARYGRAAEAAVDDPWRDQLDPLDRGRHGRKRVSR